MAFPLDRPFFGPHDYGTRKGTQGVVLHTTEGADSSLAAGLATARLQSPGGSLYAGGGSYHFILTDEGPIYCVKHGDSAGSISTRRDAVWAPQRYPYLKASLSPAAYSDPNAFLVAISVSGKTAKLSTYPHIAKIVDDCARIILWVEQTYKINAVVSMHAMWQTDRSDPGKWFFDQVMARYAELPGANQNGVVTLPDTATPATGGDVPVWATTVTPRDLMVTFPAGTTIHRVTPDGTAQFTPTSKFTVHIVGEQDGAYLYFLNSGGAAWALKSAAIASNSPSTMISALKDQVASLKRRLNGIKTKASAFNADVQDD